jgi:hypothetical protein
MKANKLLLSLCLIAVVLILLPTIAGATTIVFPKNVVFQDSTNTNNIKTFTGTMIYTKGSGVTYRDSGVILFSLIQGRDSSGNKCVMLIDDAARKQFSSGPSLTQVKTRLKQYAGQRGINLGQMPTIVQQYYKHRNMIPIGKAGVVFHVYN